MATAPVRSQQRLHNFSLEFLKWGSTSLMNKSGTHRNRHRRRELSSPSSTSSPSSKRLRSPEASKEHRSEEEDEEQQQQRRASDKAPSAPRPPKKRFGAAPCSASSEKSRKIAKKECGGGKKESAAPSEEGHEKPWNLRPRRAPVAKAGVEKVIGEDGGVAKSGGESAARVVVAAENAKPPPSQKQPKSLRLRGSADKHNGLGKEKKKELQQDKKFWISLSKDEIEQDILALTGSKPSRKPNKRPRAEQKVLDNIFPGLWLAGMTTEAYQSPQAPSKA